MLPSPARTIGCCWCTMYSAGRWKQWEFQKSLTFPFLNYKSTPECQSERVADQSSAFFQTIDGCHCQCPADVLRWQGRLGLGWGSSTVLQSPVYLFFLLCFFLGGGVFPNSHFSFNRKKLTLLFDWFPKWPFFTPSLTCSCYAVQANNESALKRKGRNDYHRGNITLTVLS